MDQKEFKNLFVLGASGAWKSFFLNLLLGFEDGDEGFFKV